MIGAFSMLALSMGMAAPAAGGQDFTIDRTIGEWTVYRFNDDCWMRTERESGTIVLLSTAQKNNDLFVRVENRAWQSIDENGSYPVRVQFGSIDRVMSASGSKATSALPPGISLFLDGSNDDYLAMLRKSPTIRVAMKGKELVSVPLDGANQAAIDYFQRCTASLKPSSDDPFKESPSADPFKT